MSVRRENARLHAPRRWRGNLGLLFHDIFQVGFGFEIFMRGYGRPLPRQGVNMVGMEQCIKLSYLLRRLRGRFLLLRNEVL